jgi:hypothetical protein
LEERSFFADLGCLGGDVIRCFNGFNPAQCVSFKFNVEIKNQEIFDVCNCEINDIGCTKHQVDTPRSDKYQFRQYKKPSFEIPDAAKQKKSAET